jgi:hypothetical protein
VIREDVSKFNGFCEQNNRNSFDLCKEILERSNNFVKSGFGYKENYLGILRKSKDLKFKYNTIYRIYKTGDTFPEILDFGSTQTLGLSQNKTPVIPFSVYEIIANSSLNDEQMKELKNVSEKERLTVKEVKKRIREYKGKRIIRDEKSVSFFCNSTDVLVYESCKEFKKMDCKGGDWVTINIKVERIKKQNKGGDK